MTKLLDANGRVLKSTAHTTFIDERMQLFARDRLEAVKDLDFNKWRVFVLRWAESLHADQVPPGGWHNAELLLPIMHATRVVLEEIPMMERVKSASWLKANGRQLPRGFSLDKGVLTGGGPVRSTNVVH